MKKVNSLNHKFGVHKYQKKKINVCGRIQTCYLQTLQLRPFTWEHFKFFKGLRCKNVRIKNCLIFTPIFFIPCKKLYKQIRAYVTKMHIILCTNVNGCKQDPERTTTPLVLDVCMQETSKFAKFQRRISNFPTCPLLGALPGGHELQVFPVANANQRTCMVNKSR